ncbi:MAG: alpha/beta hydrolase [Myxococcota bacterium]|nr:alpha/beta hydrolase [Myxococcota bacterium]
MTPQTGTLPRPQHRLGYSTLGEGPPVLLVMGLAMTGDAWHPQIRDLARDHQVCWFDNKGVGRSQAPAGRYRPQDMAADGWALADHLGWDSLHLVGVSMGGMISQQMAIQRPNAIRSLSLIASAANGRRARPTPAGVKHWVAVQTARDLRSRQESMARLLFSERTLRERPEGVLDGEMAKGLAKSRASGSALASQLHAVFSHDLRGRLPELAHLPSQCIVGTEDVLVSPQNSRELAALLQAELLEIPEAGHGVSAEAAQRVNQALRALVARVEATR